MRRLRDGTDATGTQVDWNAIDPTLIRAVNHDQLAGLQLADTVASGVYFAANRNPYGEIEDRYLRLMSRTLYRHQGRLEGYGLKFWCADRTEVDRILVAANATS